MPFQSASTVCPSHRRSHQRGQALVEFVLSMPVLLLILLAAYLVGGAMYSGANAGSALKEPVMRKMQVAEAADSRSAATAMVQQYRSGSFQITGNVVDTLDVAHADRVTAVMVGRKSVSTTLFPIFNFVVTQGINGSLLQNNTGTSSAPTALPYTPGGPETIAAAPSIGPFMNTSDVTFDATAPRY